MTKREIKKKGYKEIQKNGKNHQAVYEELKTSKASFNKEVAEQLKLIPSKAVITKWRTFIYTYIILLGAFAILRLIGMGALLSNNTAAPVLILFLLLALVLPVLGIYGAIKAKMDLVKGTSIALLFFTFRGASNFEADLPTIIVLVMVASIVFLGLFLPYKMKTPYTSTLIKQEVEGKTITSYDIIFEADEVINNDDLLDSDFA